MTKEYDLRALISRELSDEMKPSQRLFPQLLANEGIAHPFKIDLGKSWGAQRQGEFKPCRLSCSSVSAWQLKIWVKYLWNQSILCCSLFLSQVVSPSVLSDPNWTAIGTGTNNPETHWGCNWDPNTQMTFGGVQGHMWPHSFKKDVWIFVIALVSPDSFNK